MDSFSLSPSSSSVLYSKISSRYSKSQVLELYKDNTASQDMLQKLLVGSIETIAKNPAEVLDNIKGSSHPLEDIKENLSGVVDPITKLIDSAKR